MFVVDSTTKQQQKNGNVTLNAAMIVNCNYYTFSQVNILVTTCRNSNLTLKGQ